MRYVSCASYRARSSWCFFYKNHGANNKCHELCNPVGHVRATTKGTFTLNDSERNFDLSPTKLKKDNVFTGVCQSFCTREVGYGVLAGNWLPLGYNPSGTPGICPSELPGNREGTRADRWTDDCQQDSH